MRLPIFAGCAMIANAIKPEMFTFGFNVFVGIMCLFFILLDFAEAGK